MENEMTRELTIVESEAMGLSIVTDDDYSKAGETVKKIKALAKKVTDYWEPMRVSAKKAYDDVLAHKKEMLDPLDKAEKSLKGEMGKFLKRKEEERKAIEEALRAQARAEADRKLAEAMMAEQFGDTEVAEYALASAQVMENASKTVTVQSDAPKASGVSTRKTWRIKSVDAPKVPVNVDGVCIRPVDEKAVLALIKAHGGNISIDGIEFEEDVIMSVRGN